MSSHRLVVLRHGKSDWSGHEADIDRPLAPRGRRQAVEAGRWLAKHSVDLDLAVVSTASRARSTWALVSSELDDPPDVREEGRVYAASGHELLAVVQELSEDIGTVLLVGHNPGCEDLVRLMAGEWVELPTSAIAVIEVDGTWASADPSSASLVTHGRPPT